MTTLNVPLGPSLTEDQAGEIFEMGRETIIFALLQPAKMHADGDRIAVSDLVRMEWRVGPLIAGDALTPAAFDGFFASSDVQVLGVTAAVCDRAAAIRAAFRFRPRDALHVAAAVESGCDLFLTQDARLSGFSEIPLEVLS